MKHLKIHIALLTICLLSSCLIAGIITDTPGFYSGYYRLSQEAQRKIEIVNDTDSLTEIKKGNTYAITAKHLKQLAEQNAPCVIYLWSAHCGAASCIPIHSFREFCKINQYNPLIISEYYDYEMLSAQDVEPSSVFSINHWHYGSDYCNKYTRRFQEDFLQLFDVKFDAKYSYKYLYYDGQKLMTSKPDTFGKYPWQ